MKKLTTMALVVLSATTVFASEIQNPIVKKLLEKGIITKEEALELDKKDKKEKVYHANVINKKSPTFLLGKETHPNMKIHAFDRPDMYVKLGIRLQGTFENYKVDYKDPAKDDENIYDGYLRRMRFEIGVGFSKNVSFTMDVRNDKAGFQDKGEQKFNVGDAYLKVKKPFGTSLINFKFYRGKIDVSRTETVKSAWVVHYDRPYVADEAAQFVSHNRRASNAQIFGNWKKKIHYEIAIGDGIFSGKFHDAKGKDLAGAGGKLIEQDFMYGGKVFISPFDGWEETKRTERYFGVGKHIEAGIGYWRLPRIKYTDNSGTHTMDRTLINYEFSAHYKNAFIQYEYFDFDGVEKDFTDTTYEVGKSNGWYVVGEYVFPEFYYIAPFARYEEWQRWKNGGSDYKLKSYVFGVNWYLRGDTANVGIAYQEDDYGKEIGNKKVKRIKITSQWFF